MFLIALFLTNCSLVGFTTGAIIDKKACKHENCDAPNTKYILGGIGLIVDIFLFVAIKEATSKPIADDCAIHVVTNCE